MSAPLPEGRVRTPITLQMEATECGAASLGIVLAYFKRIVPLATLRRDCGVSRDGSKASNICKAAKAYGLTAKAFKKDLGKLKDLRYPYVVFWNFNHFLVVEGFRKGLVCLNDPAAGRRRITIEEFDRSYTGVVLALEPGPEFRPGGTKPSLIAAIYARVRRSKEALAAATFCALLLVIPGLVTPALISAFVDGVLVRGLQDWGRPLAIGLLLTALVRTFLTALELDILGRLQLKLAVINSAGFVWHLLRLPASYYGQRFAGEVSSRIALNDKVAEVLSGKLATSLIDVLMMVFFLAVMIRFSPLLATVALTFAVLNFLVLQWIARRRLEGSYEMALHLGKTAGFGISGLQSIRTLKASALESDFFARWAGFFANFTVSQQELALSNHILGVFPPFLSALMTCFILTAGSFLVMRGEFTVGQLVAFQSLAISFLLPVNNLVALAASIQELEGDLNRLDDVLESPALPEPPAPAVPESVKLRGKIEFRNVSFGYSPILPPLISDLSFAVEPGHRIAFVGRSGSGKSTVAKLAAGLFQPTAGEILFDGVPVAEIPHEVMTNSLAMMEQDVSMFRGSIADNITMWDSSLSREHVVESCTDAAVDGVIRGLHEGYHSDLLEGAANLSGGQRQRLEIARALVANPSILVMDEATSALDAETERLIEQNIRRRGCTCVVMAHRLSTIRDCDEIVVLHQGQTVERGTHAKLMEMGGVYWSLIADSELAPRDNVEAGPA